jgi:ribonuclease HI
VTYKAKSQWWIIADACPAVKTSPTWGAFISSYRVHWEDIHEPPRFEGAQLCMRTGINRAELLAIIYGLQAIALGMESGEYSTVRVNVLTDSQTAFNLCTGTWRRAALTALVDEADSLCNRIESCVAEGVWFIKVSEKTVKPVDTLGRSFKNVCAKELRKKWAAEEKAMKQAKLKR